MVLSFLVLVCGTTNVAVLAVVYLFWLFVRQYHLPPGTIGVQVMVVPSVAHPNLAVNGS